MNVKELKKILDNFPEEAEVYVPHYSVNWSMEELNTEYVSPMVLDFESEPLIVSSYSKDEFGFYYKDGMTLFSEWKLIPFSVVTTE